MLNKISNTIFIPFNLKIILTKNDINGWKKINLISKSKKFVFVTKNNVTIKKWCNSITINKNKFNNSKIKIDNKIQKFLNSWNIYYFNKIKFKGKGFRIKFFKKIKLIKFYFGKSHKTFMLLKNIKKKRISKYKFILYSINKKKSKDASIKIINIKYINHYTLRGLRISKQIIYKRKGKKGTYI